MVKIDLITGFLGAGKTTFLKQYAQYFLQQGQNIGILENDYGAVNVDMMLLQDMQSDQCELEMVAGGCDADCHRRRFKSKLISMGMCGYQRVIVEPSGLFDMDEFFDVLQEEPLSQWYEIGNVIAIVDATMEQTLSKDAQYLLASQVANAGILVFSKLDNKTMMGIDALKEYINISLEAIRCKRRIGDEDIIAIPWNQLSEHDFTCIASAGYHNEAYVKLYDADQSEFQAFYFMDCQFTKSTICDMIGSLQNKIYGNVFRVKGFFQENGHWYEVNAKGEDIAITAISKGQDVVIIIGENLNKEMLEKAVSKASVAIEN